MLVNTSSLPTIIFAIILFVGIVIGVFYRLHTLNEGGVMYEEVVDEDATKALTVARTNLSNNICHTLTDAWQLTDKEVSFSAELISSQTTLLTVLYKNNLVRFYINWEREKVKISLTRRVESISTITQKTFSIKESKISFEKMYAFFEKNQPADIFEGEEIQPDLVSALAQVIDTVVDRKIAEKEDNKDTEGHE